MNRPRVRIRLEFWLQDFWIGVFWKWTKGTYGSMERLYAGWELDIWVCLLPMLPIHVTLDWRPRYGKLGKKLGGETLKRLLVNPKRRNCVEPPRPWPRSTGPSPTHTSTAIS